MAMASQRFSFGSKVYLRFSLRLKVFLRTSLDLNVFLGSLLDSILLQGLSGTCSIVMMFLGFKAFPRYFQGTSTFSKLPLRCHVVSRMEPVPFLLSESHWCLIISQIQTRFWAVSCVYLESHAIPGSHGHLRPTQQFPARVDLDGRYMQLLEEKM